MFQIGNNLLFQKSFLKKLESYARQIVLITDDHIKKLYGDKFLEFLSNNSIEAHLISIPPGESSKTRESKELIENQMLELGLGRDTLLLAMGGGVITDLAGFVAATYARGIPFISIPTTLLAMVDASIGGKTGVNTPFGKNLIGAFYEPDHLLMDMTFLDTLPKDTIRDGMAEVIKHALIKDKKLFSTLQKDYTYQEVIEKSYQIKTQVVKEDAKEKSLRKILNFGHTIGHALESISNYSITHGEAVAIGLLAESYLSFLLGFITEETYSQIEQLLNKFNFPMILPKAFSIDKMQDAFTYDKKTVNAKPQFVTLDSIGEVSNHHGSYAISIEDNILKRLLQWLNSKLEKAK